MFYLTTVYLFNYNWSFSFIFNCRLFHRLDVDGDGCVSNQELASLIIGIEFEEIDLDRDDAVKKIMDDFDTSGDKKIDKTEFIRGISRWLEEAKRSVSHDGSYSKKFVDDFHMVIYLISCFL